MRPLLLLALSFAAAGCPSPTAPDAGDASDVANSIDALDTATEDTTPLPDVAPDCGPPLASAHPRAPAGPFDYPRDANLRLHHIQAEATHNSYHIRPPIYGPDWNYTHAPLDVQLEQQGVRGIELDTHYDPQCRRLGVYHLGVVDPLSTCHAFTECLAIVRAWSDAHPWHHTIFVHIEPKDEYTAEQGPDMIDAFEREILSVFPRELIVTPDEVRGTASTLRDAVTTNGWPTLGATRGRVLFYIDRTDAYRDAYTHGGTSLDGRLAFIDSDESLPFAAVMIRNGSVSDAATITRLVRANYLVRTFAETSDDAGWMNDRTGLDAALMDGAQIISTDFPAPQMGTDYFVEIPGGMPSRCNPITAPTDCTASDIEHPM
jgi:hypothetical protein